MKKEIKEELTPQEEQMEKTVKIAREKLLPYFNEKEFTVEFTKWLCENTAVIVNGGAYDLMNKSTVKELALETKVKPEYPEYETFKEFVELIQDMSMTDAINSLQWLSQKMTKVIEDENKDRKFVDLKLEF